MPSASEITFVPEAGKAPSNLYTGEGGAARTRRPRTRKAKAPKAKKANKAKEGADKDKKKKRKPQAVGKVIHQGERGSLYYKSGGQRHYIRVV